MLRTSLWQVATVEVALPLLVALVPGVIAWWTGRRILRAVSEPALAERWKKRQGLVVATCVYALIALNFLTDAWLAHAALTVLLTLTLGFGARKRLFDERWSVLAYLGQVLRIQLGLAGFFLLTAFAPMAMATAPEDLEVPLGTALLIALLLASRFGHALSRWILGAQPLQDEDLRAELDRVLERAETPGPVTVLEAGHPGGRWVNAMAMPGTHQAQVIISRTLLDALERREIAAIFGHEVGHLEMWTPPRLIRTALLVELPLALGGAYLLPLARALEPSLAPLAPIAWLIAVLGVFTYLGARRQAEEHASDLRGAELVGDPKLMASALEKLHALALYPRRWSEEEDATITHPSLARRLRALRSVAPDGASPGELGTPLGSQRPLPMAHLVEDLLEPPVRDAETGLTVSIEGGALYFAREALHRLDAAGSLVRAIRYDALRELGLKKRRKVYVLVVEDIDGGKAQHTLLEGDSARLQALEHWIAREIEPRLSPQNPARKVEALSALAPALAALVFISFSSAHFALLLQPAMLAAVLYPRVALLSASGGTAVAGAALGVGLGFPSDMQESLSSLTLLLGLFLLGVTGARALRAPAGEGLRAVLFLSGGPALAALLPALSEVLVEPSLNGVHHALADGAWGMAASAGVVSALAMTRRWVATGAAAAGLASWAFVASPSLARYVIDDPFLRARPLERRAGPPLEAVARVRIDGDGEPDVRVSLSGEVFAFRAERVPEPETPYAEAGWVIADLSGRRRWLPVHDLVFVDGRRVVVLEEAATAEADPLTKEDVPGSRRWPRSQVALRDLESDAPEPGWSIPLKKRWAQLSSDLDPAYVSVTIHDVGRARRATHVLRIEVKSGVTATQSIALSDLIPSATFSSAQRPFIVATRLPKPHLGLPWLSLLRSGFHRSSLFWVEPSGGALEPLITGTGLSCWPGGGRLLCSAVVGKSLAFAAVDPDSGDAVPLGRIEDEEELSESVAQLGLRTARIGGDGAISLTSLMDGATTLAVPAAAERDATYQVALTPSRMLRFAFCEGYTVVEVFALR